MSFIKYIILSLILLSVAFFAFLFLDTFIVLVIGLLPSVLAIFFLSYFFTKNENRLLFLGLLPLNFATCFIVLRKMWLLGELDAVGTLQFLFSDNAHIPLMLSGTAAYFMIYVFSYIGTALYFRVFLKNSLHAILEEQQTLRDTWGHNLETQALLAYNMLGGAFFVDISKNQGLMASLYEKKHLLTKRHLDVLEDHYQEGGDSSAELS